MAIPSSRTDTNHGKQKNKNKSQSKETTFARTSRTENDRGVDFNNGRGEDLPIFAHKAELIESVRKHQTTIVMGETGSGKSTQLPKYLAEVFTSSNRKRPGEAGATPKGNCVVCTQPRRVAAITVAQRVAAELDVSCGKEVGYAVRFDDCSSNSTRIKFVTDGVLLRECMTSPDLSGYSVLILDEAHERSLNTDILMGIIRDLQDRNPQLRVVVMSATLQVGIFMKYFKDTNLICIEGRQFPVEVMYTKEPEADYIDAAMRTCMHIHANQPPGGVLVFLPGQEDIENLMMLLGENLPAVQAFQRQNESKHVGLEGDEDDDSSDGASTSFVGGGGGGGRRIEDRSHSHKKQEESDGNAPASEYPPSGPVEVVASFSDFEIRPLYASMPPAQQLEAFAPCKEEGSRKFVLSTNIAETSVTINDIVYVVDTGYFKCKLNDATTGMDMLKVVPVSKQQADQRRGRAGRTRPGQCYRVYTQEVYDRQLAEEAIPEIQRVNISQVILQLKTIGVKSPQNFPFVSPPSRTSLRSAMEELLLLGALDAETADLTPLGRKMSLLPLAPMYSNLLLQSVLCTDGGFFGSTPPSSSASSSSSAAAAPPAAAAANRTPLYGCVQEMLTTVSMLSVDGVYVQPANANDKEMAAKKHRNLAVKAGDLPTLLHIYNSWVQARQSKEWASENFLSLRMLVQARDIRNQLHDILFKLCFGGDFAAVGRRELDASTTGKGKDKGKEQQRGKSPFPSCLPQLEPYLKCLAAGLCLNVAQRVADGTSYNDSAIAKSFARFPAGGGGVGGGGGAASRSAPSSDRVGAAAPYVTLRGRQPVYIHPSSVLFAASTGYAMSQSANASRGGGGHASSSSSSNNKGSNHRSNRLPPYVIYSDLLITTKSFMRGVTGVQGEWLLSTGGASGGLFQKVGAPTGDDSNASAKGGNVGAGAGAGAGQKRPWHGTNAGTAAGEPASKKGGSQPSRAEPSGAASTFNALAPQALAATHGRSVAGSAISHKYVSLSKQKQKKDKQQQQQHKLKQNMTMQPGAPTPAPAPAPTPAPARAPARAP